MDTLKHLLEKNQSWAAGMKQDDPKFFSRLAEQQSPEYLWIGCSDSRVPANQIAGLLPGEVFVHRNIANVVVHSDLNCLSVLQFAVDILKVKHIIVCGHYGCGGVRASMETLDHGLIDNWLGHIQDVHRYNQAEFVGLEPELAVDRLCELNVVAQVNNVCSTTIVRDAWRRGESLSVHSWIYGIENGILKPLRNCIKSLDELNSARRNPR